MSRRASLRALLLAGAALAAAAAPAVARPAPLIAQPPTASDPSAPPASSTASGPAAPRSAGTVVQVTPARAFLDAGAREGLRPGDAVELTRGAVAVGRCTVDRVADHSASCTGAAARAGDRFALRPPPAERPRAELPPLVDPVELARRKQALEAAAPAGVDFTGSEARGGPRPRLFLRAGQAIWAATDASTRSGQRLDVRVLDLPLGSGATPLGALSLSVDASLLRLSRPGGGEWRPGAEVMLLVWEAALAARGERGLLTLGRVLPRSAPGALRIDGAQVGLRVAPGVEVGAFGGGVPDPGTLEPTSSRATAGGWFSAEHTGLRSDLVAYASTSGRVAWVRAPELGTRAELESSSLLQLKTVLGLAADVRFGLGDAAAPGGLDAARLALDLHPTERLSLTGSLRYTGAALREDTALAVASGPSRHGDAALSWEVARALVIGAEGGLARDDTSGATFSRAWGGPTLALPRLFGSAGGLSAGAQLERGDLAGWSAWLGATLQPGERFQLQARATAALDNRAAGRDLSVGLFASARARLLEHLALQATVLGRLQPVALGVVPPDLIGGVFADLGLRGEF